MMNEEEWMTVREAAEWVNRSRYTIYTWVRRTVEGVAEAPLTLRKKENTKGWLIKIDSLAEADSLNGGSRGRGYKPKSTYRLRGSTVTNRHDATLDTIERVQSDRKRWVSGWIEEGKTLDRILEVFSSGLHQEITEYYHQLAKDIDCAM